jgi:hypothetical protein
MKRENEGVLAGGIGFTPRSSCMPAGVPAFMLFRVVEPIFFVQSPKMVLMIFAGDAQICRRIPFRPSEAVVVWEGDRW